MSVEYVQNEVEYYTGRKCSKEEAQEIIWFVKNNKASLEEVISAYYGC